MHTDDAKPEYQLIKAKAVKALMRREHSRPELALKLGRFTTNSMLIDQVLDECEAANWLNNERFVLAYIRSRSQKHYGPKKIQYELQQRGVDKATIQTGFAECEVNWEDVKQETIVRKFGAAPAKSWQEKAKQDQYLYQRGF